MLSGDLDQALVLVPARRDEPALLGNESAAHGSHLLGPDGDRVRLGRDDRAEALRPLALRTRLGLRVADLLGDPPVLHPECVHVFGLGDEVRKAPGGQQHIERGRLAALVEIDEPVVQTLDDDRVLAAQREKALRLDSVELREPRELLPVESEIALDRHEPR